MKVEANWTCEEAIDKIVSKLPVQSSKKEFSLYLPKDKIWLKKEKKILGKLLLL